VGNLRHLLEAELRFCFCGYIVLVIATTCSVQEASLSALEGYSCTRESLEERKACSFEDQLWNRTAERNGIYFGCEAAEMSNDDPSAYLRVSSTRDVLEQTRMFDSKKWLWVPDDEEGFKAACVKSQKGDSCLLELSDGSVSRLFDYLPDFHLNLMLLDT